jgi:hypothetical protein
MAKYHASIDSVKEDARGKLRTNTVRNVELATWNKVRR